MLKQLQLNQCHGPREAVSEAVEVLCWSTENVADSSAEMQLLQALNLLLACPKQKEDRISTSSAADWMELQEA